MATYEYVDKTGNLKTVDAADANSAISSAADRATTSGVSLSNTQTKTNSGTKEPTLADALGTSGYNAPTPEGEGLKYTDIDPEKIRRDVLQRYQGQINATKAAYSTLLGETKATGTGRLGENTAQQARGGLLGSDFGQAQTDKTRQLNQSQEEKVLESQATAISNIMAQAHADASSEINAKRTANQYGYEASKQYASEAAARKEANLKKLALSLIRSSVDPQTMGAQLKDIAKTYKVSEADIINSYLNEKYAEDEAKKTSKYQTLGAGSSIYDPDTGEIVYEGTKTSDLTPYQKFQATQAIQKGTQKNTDTQRELKRQASVINTAWDRYLNGQSKDLNAVSQAIVTTYNKILDPTSVVRESEYARSAAGQSLLDQISGKYQQLSAGGAGLTEESLQEMVDLANEFTANSDASIQSDNQRARDMADQFGLNSDFVTSSGWEGSDDFAEEW